MIQSLIRSPGIIRSRKWSQHWSLPDSCNTLLNPLPLMDVREIRHWMSTSHRLLAISMQMFGKIDGSWFRVITDPHEKEAECFGHSWDCERTRRNRWTRRRRNSVDVIVVVLLMRCKLALASRHYSCQPCVVSSMVCQCLLNTTHQHRRLTRGSWASWIGRRFPLWCSSRLSWARCVSNQKIAPWSSRWFEEILILLTLISLTLISLTLILLTLFCLKNSYFFTQHSQFGNSLSTHANGTNLTKQNFYTLFHNNINI